MLATFDAPSWEICQLKRARTNTPLQALALLNDVTYVEAAHNLAGRMLLETQADGDGNSQSEATTRFHVACSIRYGFDLVNLRAPTESELKTLLAGYDNYLEYYTSQPEQAHELSQVGNSKTESNVEAPQFAAMTTIAAILLNLDEALTKE